MAIYAANRTRNYQPVPEAYDRADFVLDSDADVASLPTSLQPGSTAIVADSTGHVYMLSPSFIWKPFGWEANNNG